MRIASWNVNSVRTRLQQILEWLEAERPEVLCLQETKVADPLFPHDPFQSLGYRAAISGQKAYNGVAILSRLPMEDVRLGFSGLLSDPQAAELSEQKRLISARIEGLRVLNLYVPNGSALNSDKYHYKLAWLACLERYLKALRQGSEEPLIMLGDFNIAPEDRDLHDPARLSGGIMASEAERQGLRALTADQLADAFRMFESQAGHWSWWDYRSGAWEMNRGWRIDHIYLDEALQSCATGCVIHRQLRGNEQPSDHAPVVVHLAWPPQEGEELEDDWDRG
ncbi:MAG: exodeoxyribonuclease III [Synechococcaceae cyanobacterium]|nr:exodeoxyribonuclease III [Synechococcaceae cyanobacterium]